MSPTQRLQQVIDANRPRVHGGMRGGFELLAGRSTSQWWKRQMAARLISMRENRSVLAAHGRRQTDAAERLADIRYCRLRAVAVRQAERNQAEPMRLADIYISQRKTA